ncbi:MAG: hypothetical protein FD157_3540 [Rhodocyclaceae bacterium]|nr:MAG: hypothetical protein FD157_3540 [Rhodocyclaceae bacterium]TND01847.1 MAG: hypothetical protein FD118_2106 [Rhodocyclaceae bacterium]
MSLVNKMLRDLDARRIGDSDRAAFPTAVTPLAARQESRRGVSWMWFGAILVAVGLGTAVWFGRNVTPAAPSVAAAPAAPAAAAIAAEPAVVANAALPSLRLDNELSAVPARAAEPPRKAMAFAPKATERPAAAAPSRPPVVALPKVPPVSGEARIDKQVRLPSAAERAEIEYRRGVLAQRQGALEEAAGSYRAALEEFPEHAAARQMLAALLIDAKRFDEAEEILRRGTELASARLASTLAWARLKVERHQAPAALELLQKNAASGEQSAEYQGFAGALLNRAGRAPEAVERYQAATRLAPNEGRWWAGLGIALDAAGKGAEAREAYQKARALPGLPADLAQHVEHRLR